jgi:hypothetical protein
MGRHNLRQAKELKHYQAVRHYQVVYQGFIKSVMASMDVEVTYDVSFGKRFRVLSQSGSKLLREKVLMKAIDSEREASKNESANALTSSNYRFQLLGIQSIEGRQAYILSVEPLTQNRYLYQGTAWVDATDFAASRIEAEPAENPSFWITRPKITYKAAKDETFWLPKYNRSETKIRVGGKAVFTIDYGKFKIDPHH